MEVHARAPLGPIGRRRVVDRVLGEGWSVVAAAGAAGVSSHGVSVAGALAGAGSGGTDRSAFGAGPDPA
jgi:hypothetical protein